MDDELKPTSKYTNAERKTFNREKVLRELEEKNKSSQKFLPLNKKPTEPSVKPPYTSVIRGKSEAKAAQTKKKHNISQDVVSTEEKPSSKK